MASSLSMHSMALVFLSPTLRGSLVRWDRRDTPLDRISGHRIPFCKHSYIQSSNFLFRVLRAKCDSKSVRDITATTPKNYAIENERLPVPNPSWKATVETKMYQTEQQRPTTTMPRRVRNPPTWRNGLIAPSKIYCLTGATVKH